jgi:hypothetical protein
MSTHNGSCHCGAIAFSFDGEIGQALSCNCSICARKGSLLHFCPATTFRLKTPEENIATYKFNTHQIAHHFCRICGIAPFSRATDKKGNPGVAVNLRCVDGIDPAALPVMLFDGRSL